MRKRILLNPSRSLIRTETVVQAMVRETITRLLSKQEVLVALRELLPTHALIRANEPSDLEYWRLNAQLEMLLNDRSDIDIDDALALAYLADVIVESTMAELRGG